MTANSHDQSPIEVNFKRASYDRPNQFDDYDIGDGTGFEDFPIADVGSFIGHETLDQHDAPIRQVGIPLPKVPLVTVYCSNCYHSCV